LGFMAVSWAEESVTSERETTAPVAVRVNRVM
jgi:hypothetical protein